MMKSSTAAGQWKDCKREKPKRSGSYLVHCIIPETISSWITVASYGIEADEFLAPGEVIAWAEVYRYKR